jgi:hypothetical protein
VLSLIVNIHPLRGSLRKEEKAMSTDKALELVGPIMDAYNAAEKAGASALRFALECGKHLCAAFNTVGKGKWKKWCASNLPTVSEETERVYRRLAKAVGLQEDVFAKCKSIRDALAHLSGLDENLNPKPAPAKRSGAKRTGSSAAALEPPEPDTPSGLKAELENAGADEIIVSIEADADKLEEVAKASIARMSPDKVCDALTKAWTADQLRDLIKRVNVHLGTLAVPPPPAQTPAFRRSALS